MINIKHYKNLKSINSDFVLISSFFEKKIGKYWWFINSSRLDLAPMGLPTSNNSFYNIFRKILLYLNFTFYLFVKLFSKYKNVKFQGKYIFIFEDIKLKFNLKNKEDYYFSGLSKKINIKFINIVIGYKIFNDGKNFSIFEISNKKDIFYLFLKSVIIYTKFNFLKNKVIKKTSNQKFWKNYQNKNNFINFFLSNLTYCYFKRFNFGKNKLIYPYEEKPYERAVNHNRLKNEKKNIFAYLINPRDNLALYFFEYKNLKIPRPDKYLFTGKIIAKRFSALKRKNIINYKKSVVGTPKEDFYTSKYKKKNTFLVLIGHPSEFKIFFNSLKTKYHRSNINFIFRFPPGVNINIFEKKFENLNNFKISINKSLIDDCKLSKFSIFSNTSAGIESVNLGLISMWFKIYNLNLSPLENHHNKYFFCSKNNKELYKNIDKLINLNYVGYKKKQKNQFDITKNICSKLDLYQLRKIII